MRHGRSPGMLEAGVKRDFDRPLSPQGAADAQHTAQRLKEKGGTPAVILTSPLLRAKQTAQAVSKIFPSLQPQTYKPLSNHISGAKLMAELVKDGFSTKEVLLVGHFPQMPELAQHLSGQEVTFSPAELAAFDVTGESGRLLWSLSPSDS